MSGDSIIRPRTLRRQQRSERLKELLTDMEKVDRLLQATTDKRVEARLTQLLDYLYDAYCQVIDSEV